MDRESIISKVKIKLDEVTPPGVDLPFDDFIGPILDECAKEVAEICPLHLLSPVSIANVITGQLGVEKIIDWITTTSPHEYETFISSGKNITLAVNAVGTMGSCYTNTPIPVTIGKIYLITIDLTINSGVAPWLTLVFIPYQQLVAGINHIYITIPIGADEGDYFLGLEGETEFDTSARNFSATCSMKETNTDNADGGTIFVNNKCYIPKPADFLRLYEMKFPLWVKSVREITKPDSDAGKIQDNPYLASGIGRPTVILTTTWPTGGSLREYLVCGKVASLSIPIALYVKIPKPETLPDQLIDSLTWLAAGKVSQIGGRGDLAQGLTQQYHNSLTQLAKA